MKPLNRDEPGCNYTSSNCVIWQGPDIPCIKICKGDSVSDVVFNLATELCDVLDTLDINKYDISCLNLAGCAPANFHDFLQALITLICNLQDCCQAGNPAAPAAQDSFLSAQMPINPFYYFLNEFGDTVTTMTGRQYLITVANQSANTQTQLDSVTTTVAAHTDQINTLQIDVASIPPTTALVILPVCTSSPAGVPIPIDQAVQNLETAFCELQAATGPPLDIYQSLTKECVGLTNLPTLDGSGRTYGSITGWNNAVGNLAGSIGNMWLFLCDIRAGILNIKANCCGGNGCDGIQLSLTANFSSGSNLITLFIQGFIPPGFVECAPANTIVTLTDTTGGSWLVPINLLNALNNPYNISLVGTPLNPASNISVSIPPCLKDATGVIVCQSVLNYLIVNEAICPAMIYTPSTNTIGYSGTSNPGTATYTVELWNGDGSTLISSQVQALTGPAPILGTFPGLPVNTSYRVRLTVGIGTPLITTNCQFVPVSLELTDIPRVELGAAISFFALAGAGIANVGTSSFIGDVGSDPTFTVSGIAPGDVTGILYTTGPQAAVIAAQVSLGNAKAYIAGLTPFVTIADVIDGVVLTPGYYNFTGGTIVLGTNVTFDGLGSPNSVWVLDAATSLAIAGGATVTLINGALFSNIFWNIGTTATIGNAAIVKGYILADGNIIVGTAADVQGALLTVHGLQDLDNMTGSNI
jgi:hypothetical protein